MRVLLPLARWLLVCGLLVAAPAQADFSVETGAGDVVDVRVFPGESGQPLFIWLVDEYGHHQAHDDQMAALAETGAEVWQVDLLESYFLERTSRNVRELSGAGIGRLIREAVARGHDSVTVVGAERMAVPVLRGVHVWQQAPDSTAIRVGAVLFYPNLYAGTPVAGEEPELLPIAGATTLPVFILQPEEGANRWRLPEMLGALDRHRPNTYTYLIPGVRDWFYLHTDDPTPREAELQKRLPTLLRRAAERLADSPQPASAREPESRPESTPRAVGLVPIEERPEAPDFTLPATRGGEVSLADYRGRVTLVNFWATWCPSCVEEIPSMNRLAARFDEDEFAIVSVNFKQSRETVADFLDQVTVDFPVLLDRDGKVSQQWQVFSFPSSFLVDRQGRVRYSVNSGILWDKS